MTDHNAEHRTSRQELVPATRLVAALIGATAMHPQHADALMHAAPLLAPTDALMHIGGPQLYASHVAELLDRIVRDDDLTLPTAAELLVVCSSASLRAPLNGSGAALYAEVFGAVFAGHPLATDLCAMLSSDDRAGGADARARLTRSMQRQIAAGPVRGTRQIAAWRAAAGLPTRRRATSNVGTS